MDSRQHARLPVNPVGDLLRGWRNRRAMSQADLAFEAGISIKHLSYVETGETETPGPLCEVHLRKGDVDIGLIGAVLTLATPQDVTLQELRVEMFMPADEGSEALLVELGR